MNLPTPLHAMLWQCAREPTPDWCSVERFILADYLEETGDAERAGKIRELSIRTLVSGYQSYQSYWDVFPAEVSPGWSRESSTDAYSSKETAQRVLRRRVLALFPEVEFEVRIDVTAKRVGEVDTSVFPAPCKPELHFEDGRIFLRAFFKAPDLLPPESESSPPSLAPRASHNRITGPRDPVTGLYPAVVQHYNLLENAWEDGEEIWFDGSHLPEPPTVGRRYVIPPPV